MALSFPSPGVYLQQYSRPAAAAFGTGVPAFLGSTSLTAAALTVSSGLANNSAVLLDLSAFKQLEGRLGTAWVESPSNLPYAVRGFFENGGTLCYIVTTPNPPKMNPHGPNQPTSDAVRYGLQLIDALDEIDLVCAPDLAFGVDFKDIVNAQMDIVNFCEGRGDWVGRPVGVFAILDTIPKPGTKPEAVTLDGITAHRDALFGKLVDPLTGHSDPEMGASAALYTPWIVVQGPITAQNPNGFMTVPPCGHAAGIYASTDVNTGVHASPANQVMQGILNLQFLFDDVTQGILDPMPGGPYPASRRINCLRAFPTRGIRMWGASTMSLDSNWMYLSVRRTSLTIQRWLAINMTAVAFEPNDFTLWLRISRQVNDYLGSLYERGAFQGINQTNAYYVKCDAETNTADVVAAGQVVTEIGIAAVNPSEFIVIRLVTGATADQATG